MKMFATWILALALFPLFTGCGESKTDAAPAEVKAKMEAAGMTVEEIETLLAREGDPINAPRFMMKFLLNPTAFGHPDNVAAGADVILSDHYGQILKGRTDADGWITFKLSEFPSPPEKGYYGLRVEYFGSTYHHYPTHCYGSPILYDGSGYFFRVMVMMNC